MRYDRMCFKLLAPSSSSLPSQVGEGGGGGGEESYCCPSLMSPGPGAGSDPGAGTGAGQLGSAPAPVVLVLVPHSIELIGTEPIPIHAKPSGISDPRHARARDDTGGDDTGGRTAPPCAPLPPPATNYSTPKKAARQLFASDHFGLMGYFNVIEQ